MPYDNEKASKISHLDFVRNPDIANFLKNCDFIEPPNDEECKKIADTFIDVPMKDMRAKMVVAADGSNHIWNYNEKMPNSTIGYIKISFVLINMDKYSDVRPDGTCFVDPFKLAEIMENSTSLTFALPGANMFYKDEKSVSDSFRKAVFENLSGQNTNFVDGDTKTAIDTLRMLMPGSVIEKCPCCSNILNYLINDNKSRCPVCGETLYISDILRMHENFSETEMSVSGFSEFMSVCEQLIMAELVNCIFNHSPETLSRMAFIIDGPLAVFRHPAKLHSGLMAFYNGIRKAMLNMDLDPPAIIGVQKTGYVTDHLKTIEKHLRPGSLRIIDDEYRAIHIKKSKLNDANFGNETYFGQDFLFKTEKNTVFCFSVPYPFDRKDSGFKYKKTESYDLYEPMLSEALSIIRTFDSDLYENSLTPVIMAHSRASISMKPGGMILDFITKNSLSFTGE